MNGPDSRNRHGASRGRESPRSLGFERDAARNISRAMMLLIECRIPITMESISRISPFDSLRTHELYPIWDGVMPFPPKSLLWSVGGSSLENFLVVADAWD